MPHRMVRVWPRQAVNRALEGWVTMDHREVVAVESPRTLTASQSARRRGVTCKHKDSRGVTIEAVDRSNRLDAPEGVAVSPRHGVRNGARLLTSRRMGKHACRLRDGQHVLVLEEDVQRHLPVGHHA